MKFDVDAHLALIRPVNCAITLLSVLVGAGMTGDIVHPIRALTAALSAALIAGGGNALNDACDEATDRINRPSRPIPSGRVSRRVSTWLAAALFAGGGGLGLFLGAQAGFLAFAAIGGLVIYDVFLKRVPLAGNAAVSGISGLALIYGGAAAGKMQATLIPALFAFLIHLGREILKDVEDVEGDAAAGHGSLAVSWGVRPALAMVTGVFSSLILLTPVPFCIGVYSWRYLVLAICPVDIILVYAVVSMWRDRSRQNLLRLDRLVKVDMVFGLLALWVG